MQLEVGSVVEGKITGITNFGAFVQLEDGKTGLIHISEIATDYVKDINDHVKVNQKVRAKVISVAPGGKISLSIRKLIQEERATRSSRPADVEMFKHRDESLSFDDMMNKFKMDSDEKMQTLKRSFESKRGGFGGRRKN